MLYFIDSADKTAIREALDLGACGVTANTSMYRKNNVSIIDFVKTYSDEELEFLSAEVIGNYEEMLKQAEELVRLNDKIVIKINFSKDGLRLVKTLHKKGVTTAMTLIFTMGQAVAAVNAGCNYLFFFIGRNEEVGGDAMYTIANIQEMLDVKGYDCSVVAASIKNLYQLEKLAELHIDYAAIPYDLYMKSLNHPLTESGAETFINDYYENSAIRK